MERLLNSEPAFGLKLEPIAQPQGGHEIDSVHDPRFPKVRGRRRLPSALEIATTVDPITNNTTFDSVVFVSASNFDAGQ